MNKSDEDLYNDFELPITVKTPRKLGTIRKRLSKYKFLNFRGMFKNSKARNKLKRERRIFKEEARKLTPTKIIVGTNAVDRIEYETKERMSINCDDRISGKLRDSLQEDSLNSIESRPCSVLQLRGSLL